MNDAIASAAAKVYMFLLPVSWICLAFAILILLPLACFQGSRNAAGKGLMAASYVFGVTTWFLGAAVTFTTWGWTGLIIGLVLGGVGVVPVGILAAFIAAGNYSLGLSMIVMVVVVFASRVGGFALTSDGYKHKSLAEPPKEPIRSEWQ